LYNLSRNVGSSVGISVVSYLLTRNGQINHAIIESHITAVNPGFGNSVIAHAWSPWTAPERAALDQAIQIQASVISCIDDFKLMMILSLRAIPRTLAAACRVGGEERRCDGDGVITFGAQRSLGRSAKKKGNATNSSWRLPLLASLSTETFAQHAGTDQGEKACLPDVKRFCRKWMIKANLLYLPA